MSSHEIAKEQGAEGDKASAGQRFLVWFRDHKEGQRRSELAAPAEAQGVGLGKLVMQWVRAGVGDGRIKVNVSKAKVHLVDEGVLLMSPAIFRSAGQALGVDWRRAQSGFLKLHRHRRFEHQNFCTYTTESGREINGILVEDPALIFLNDVPPPNAMLRPASAVVTNKKAPRTAAQPHAEQRNNEKRHGTSRLPASLLSDDESRLLDEAAALVGGSKKDAILAGLRVLMCEQDTF